jgi:hypothetical protein
MVAIPGKAAAIGSFVQTTLASLRGNTFRAQEEAKIPCGNGLDWR